MALEQYFEEALAHSGLRESDGSGLGKWESADIEIDSGVNPSSGFDCNICVDSVQEPVVTLCGHLYCWPCIYKWLHSGGSPTEDEPPSPQRCPVCKADISLATLVPLYGRGLAAKPSERQAPDLGVVIPKRPTAPGCGVETPRSPARTIFSPRLRHEEPMRFVHPDRNSYRSSPVSRSGSRRLNPYDPGTGMLVGSTSPRIRRRMAQADRSLGRLCFFLFCCALLCLVLF